MDKNIEKGLPVARIRTIMKSLPNIENLNPASVFLVTKATELFIQYLAKQAYAESQSNEVEYKHIAQFIDNEDHLDFLKQIIPKKMKVSQVKKLLAESESSSDSSSGEETEDDSASSSSSSVIAISDTDDSKIKTEKSV